MNRLSSGTTDALMAFEQTDVLMVIESKNKSRMNALTNSTWLSCYEIPRRSRVRDAEK